MTKKRSRKPKPSSIRLTNRVTGESMDCHGPDAEADFDLDGQRVTAGIVEMLDDGSLRLRLTVGCWKLMRITPVTASEVYIDVIAPKGSHYK
jgi:hypothetical protein